jgi:hypothetical protein
MGLGRLAQQRNYRVRIYRDAWVLPWLLGKRFLRPRLFRDYTTHLDHPLTPASMLDVLMEQTRWDHIRGRETDLASFSMDVWLPEEVGEPGGRPLLQGWRYTPETHQTVMGTVSA